MPKYEILDEPNPSSFGHLACNPFWIFLATMLGGVWLGWAWSAFNSFAIGSFAKTKELVLIGVGLVGSVVLTLWGNSLLTYGVIEPEHVKYALTVLIVWKLLISYRLHLWQAPSFQLHEYFGGRTRNGLLILIVGIIARPRVLSTFDGTIFSFVLA